MMLSALGIPTELADDARCYFRWWARLIAALILTLGVVW
jgi:hypothetical protein